MNTAWSLPVADRHVLADDGLDHARPRISASLAFLCSIPLGAGVGALTDGISIGGLQFSGFVWIVYLGVGLLLLLGRMALTHRVGFVFPVGGWLPWACVVWTSLLWGEGIRFHNLQEAIQLTMPLFVGLLSSSIVRRRSELTLLFVSFFVAGCLILISVPVEWTGLLGVKEQGNRAAALAATLFGCVLIALFPQQRLAGVSGWAICVLMTFISGSRMATAALMGIPVLHPLFRRVWIRPLAILALMVGGVAMFNSRTFQERFFHSGSGTLTDVARGDYLDFGRMDAWPPLLERAWRSPFIGWGAGTAYDFVPLIWPRMKQCHNDYIRVFFETGLLGLGCYLAALGRQFWLLRRELPRHDGRLQQAFAAAYMGLLALALTSLTDNTLGYNLWFTNPLFMLMGAAFGVAHAERQQAHRTLRRAPLTSNDRLAVAGGPA